MTQPYPEPPYSPGPSGYPGSPAPMSPGYPTSGDLTPAYGAPYGQAPGMADPPLITIGDITVTRTSVTTPQGTFPLRGTTWTVQDSTQVTESIPTHAIVLAIVFAVFCLIGLLFLLMKEKKYTGFVSVTVVGPNFYHSVQFPPGPQVASWATAQVNSARALAASA